MANASAAESASRPPCTLHHLNSSQSLRVLWALEELSPLKYNLKLYKRIKGRAPPELKNVFPLGKSPVLTVDKPGDAGNMPNDRIVIAESRRVIQYIADRYSNGVWTSGQNAKEKEQDEYWAEVANATLGPVLGIALTFDLMPSQTPFFARPLTKVISSTAVPKVVDELVEPFKLMEATLSGRDGAVWFAGPCCGIADFNMSWPMDLASQRGYFDAAKYPAIAAWLNRVHERPAYKRALEKGGDYDLITFGGI